MVRFEKSSYALIKNIFLESENRSYFSNNFEEKYSNCENSEFYMINSDDRNIGGLILHDYDAYSNRIMFTISLKPDYQNMGLGNGVMRYLLEYLFIERKIRRIYIEVYETNRRAIGLYEKFGFKMEGRLRKHTYKNGDYVDLFIMGLLRDEYDMIVDNCSGGGK